MKYTITQSRILYVLRIDDRKHHNLLKIGEVFVDNEIADNPSKQELFKAVREILDKRSYMQGVTYHLDFVECTTYNQHTECYKADDVHRTLKAMGITTVTHAKIETLYKKEDADIWFQTSLEKVQEAINKIKEGNGAGYGAIQFRPEQQKAIEETVKHFHKPNGKTFLWNAKMRFGKTLSGLEVAKQMGYKSTLIITHRPVVDDGWSKDFEKIFRTQKALEEYKGKGLEPAYGRRMMDDKDSHGDFYTLTKDVDEGKKILVFFVSMQYLRLSQFVGGKEHNPDPLKKAIMQYDWDFVMVDEAHEGIEAAAGVRVMEKLKKENTRILSLSGTPFNLLDKYDEGEIYTWDYVMEQREKVKWDDEHFGDPNPYADLPRMQILTFTLPKMVRDEVIERNEIFKFHEFFRVWTEEDKKNIQQLIDNETDALKRVELQTRLAEIRIDKFIHEGAVKRFLNKLVEDSETSKYPFSKEEFRENFKHTFWLLPGVKEAAALKELLDEHEIFGVENGMFHIINAAGDGNIEDKDGSALADVEDNIRGNAAKNITKKEYTITLSCGKLTTGVSVPEWTAVLCMKGSENTPAANYMQTIFRVQTHAVLDGRQKSDCYVFDFAPDRALTAVAETAKMAVYAQGEKGKRQLKLTQKKEEEHLQAFIKLCPVLSMDEGEMGKHFSANQIFEKLSNVYIERAVRSGYADNSLYNPEQLMNLTPEQEKALGDVHDLLGSMPTSWKPEKININKNGLGDGDGAEQIKYIYCLTADKNTPTRPAMSEKKDENGCPLTEDVNWSDVMNAPTKLFPYLFVSNSRLIEDSWTSFSQPVLWKEWIDPEPKKDDAKKKKEEENKEKRARMSVLRGVSIRIPLLVYGAEILLEYDDLNEKDSEDFKKWAEKKNIDIRDKSKLTPKEIEDIRDWLVDVKLSPDYFTSLIDDASWEEFMPKGFTKKTFNILKDCFDRSIFTGAAKRIRQMVKEADDLNTEDRINKIATIFSYFHNPDKETVLTPWRVVNMHMSDCLGGWCFFNEEFDGNYTIENEYGENINAARPVGIKLDENGKVIFENSVTKDVFGNYNARILEINSKTGLYPLYMAYSLFKSRKEPEWRNMDLTGERGKSCDAEQYYHQAGNDLLIWQDVLQDNIFVVCRTKMAVSITKRTLAGFRTDVRMNVKCYEREIDVNTLVKAGILKEHLTINKKGVYVYDGKTEVTAKKLYENGDLQRNEVTIIGKDDEEDDSKKKVLYEGKEKVNVASLVESGVLNIRLTKEGSHYLYDGEKSIMCDMIKVLSAKPDLFQQDIVQGKVFWDVYNSIPTSKNEDINNMKFNAIVGNPPYQIENDSNRKAPIYHLFYDTSFKLASKVSLITPARFLFRVGQTPKEWMDSILNNSHFKVVKYFNKSTDIFDNVDIKGGITYTYYDANEKYEPIGFFSNYDELKDIKNKVCTIEEMKKGNLGEIVSSQGIYKLTSAAFTAFPNISEVQGSGTGAKITSKIFEALPELFTFMPDANVTSVKILGICGSKREFRWINANYVESVHNLMKYKVLVPQANGSGKIGEPLSSPIVVEPNVGHTDTFLSIGSFDTKFEADACLKYIKTKFARTMLATLKVTQNNPSSVWVNIPMQDFSQNSDIDWNMSINEVDSYLYTKYGLSGKEIKFIENNINSME